MTALVQATSDVSFDRLREQMIAGTAPSRLVVVAVGTPERFDRREFRVSANLGREQLTSMLRQAAEALAPAERGQIAQALRIWKGFSRPSDFADPEYYAKNCAVVLATYPAVAVAAFADMTRPDHVARVDRRFTPTIGEVCAWLDAVVRPYRDAVEQGMRYLSALDGLEGSRVHPQFLHEGDA